MINLIRNTRDWVGVLFDELARAATPRPVEVVDEITLPVLPVTPPAPVEVAR